VTDNITVLSNSTVLSNPLLNQPVMTNVTAPILSDKRIVTVNQQEAASRKDVLSSTPSIENISTNKTTHKKNVSNSRTSTIIMLNIQPKTKNVL